MICTRCQHENQDGDQSCRICGTSLRESDDAEQIPCMECGNPNAPGGSFCTSCGSAVNGGPTPLEHGAVLGRQLPPLPHVQLPDIVDFTFSIYGSHFLPFVLISLILQLPSIIVFFVLPAPEPPTPENPILNLDADQVAALGVSLLVSLVFGVIAWAAIIHGVCRHFIGRPVLVSHSILYALRRSLYLLAAVGLVILGLLIPFVLSLFIIGIPLLAFLIVIWIFSVHTVVIEQRGPVDALKRSWAIVQGSWWRVFGATVGLALTIFGAAVLGGLILRLGAGIAQPIGILLSISFSTLFSPLPTIALTVLYLDTRGRKDEYTHSDLAREIGDIP